MTEYTNMLGPWRRLCLCLLGAAALLSGPAAKCDIPFDMVEVGDPGNPHNPFHGIGRVLKPFRIGQYEVMNRQYAKFLNNIAQFGDPHELYHTAMTNDVRGGVNRFGSGTTDDPFGYAARPFMGDKPVNFISWWDAARFVNWLHNGQGSGDTEDGAYDLSLDIEDIRRKPGAQWFLPSRNEWYKAAAYDPSPASAFWNYWEYATRSNLEPTRATADEFGNTSNPGLNIANTNHGAIWQELWGHVTTVGSAGDLSASYYGTYDQTGNVAEWTETDPFSGTSRRFLSGGNWASPVLQLPHGLNVDVASQRDVFGFRIASVIPEPTTFLLVAVGSGAVLRRKR